MAIKNKKAKQKKARDKRKKVRNISLPILQFDDLKPVVCRPATMDDLALVPAIMSTLLKAKDGVGIAAPQVGHNIRMFIIHVQTIYPLVCFNPSFTDLSKGMVSGIEGCLSYPGLQKNISRHQIVSMVYRDEAWQERRITLEGTAARVAQHEMDHLGGLCMVYNGKRKGGG